MDEDREEPEALAITVMRDSTPEEYVPEEHEESDGHELQVDPPREEIVSRKRPAWLRDTLQEAERHPAPNESSREIKRPRKFSSYSTLMTHIIDFEPSSFDEPDKLHVWKNAMMEGYQSIMKNDVWEIVQRPKGKSVVTSKWTIKIKHVADGSVEKYKARFVARGFSQKES